MEAIKEFFYHNMGLIFLSSALVLTMAFLDVEEKRSQYLIDDTNQKSAISLNISAAQGERYVNRAEVITSLMELPSNILVSVNGRTITEHERKLATRNLISIIPYVPDGEYEVIRVFNNVSEIQEIQYTLKEDL